MREGLSRTGQEKRHVSTRVDPWIIDRLDDLWSQRGICSKAALLLEAVLEHSDAPSIEVLLDDILRTHRPVAPRERPEPATATALRTLIRGAGETRVIPRPSLRDPRRPPPRQRVEPLRERSLRGVCAPPFRRDGDGEPHALDHRVGLRQSRDLVDAKLDGGDAARILAHRSARDPRAVAVTRR